MKTTIGLQPHSWKSLELIMKNQFARATPGGKLVSHDGLLPFSFINSRLLGHMTPNIFVS